MRRFKSQIGNVQGQAVSYQFENPVLSCRCSQGKCSNRRKGKGCHKVKTENHGIACHVMDRFDNSLSWISETYFENRAEILKENCHLLTLEKTTRVYDPNSFQTVATIDSLAFQDILYPDTVEAIERELAYKVNGATRRQQYNRASAKARAQKLIDDELADFRENKSLCTLGG